MFEKIGERFSKWIERRASIDDTNYWPMLFGATTRTRTGENVDADTAMTVSAVYACVRLLSETIASLPLNIYRKEGDRSVIAEDHYLYDILHNKPNKDMTSFELREMIVAHLLLRGNAYIFLEMTQRGKITQLIPLSPARMIVKRENGNIVYIYTHEDGRQENFPQTFIWHPKGLSSDGLIGLSPITLAREAIGLAMASESYGIRFYANSARPGGILKTQHKLKPETAKKLKEDWKRIFSGDGQFTTAVLEEGLEWQAMGLSNEDAQFLETRKFQVNEIARIFRVPPHMIGDLERATFSNVEEQSLEFLTYSLRPWLERLEQSMEVNLLSPQERKQYFIEHKIDALLRGNTEARYKAFSIAFNNGIMTTNEIRKLENLNPVENGDQLYIPMNIRKLGEEPEEEQKEVGMEPDQVVNINPKNQYTD